MNVSPSWTKILLLVGSLVSTSASQYSVVRHNPLSLLSSSLKTFSVSAVQETILSLQCPHAHRILIISALMEDDTCNVTRTTFLPLILSHCQSQSGCSLLVSDTTIQRPDTCLQPSKNLIAKVDYQCRPSKFSTDLTCAGETISLQCPASSVIVILSSSYLN